MGIWIFFIFMILIKRWVWIMFVLASLLLYAIAILRTPTRKKATILPTIAKRAAKAQKELTHKAYVYDSLREK